MTRAHEWENKTTYNVFCLYLLCVMSIGFLIYIVATLWYNKYCKEVQDMPKLINLTGQKFGRLTALYKLNNL